MQLSFLKWQTSLRRPDGHLGNDELSSKNITNNQKALLITMPNIRTMYMANLDMNTNIELLVDYRTTQDGKMVEMKSS